MNSRDHGLKRLFEYSVCGVYLCIAGVAVAAADEVPSRERVSSSTSEVRGWLPRDSARARYVLTHQDADGWTLDKTVGSNAIVASPGGKYFFFVTQKGDLDCDCNVYELSVYAVSEVVKALRSSQSASHGLPPWRMVTMRHKMQAIASAAWVDGEEAIEFWGKKEPNSQRQIYRLTIASGELEPLAKDMPPSMEMVGYGRQGKSVIYTLRKKVEVPGGRYPFYALTTERIQELVYDKGMRTHFEAETFVTTAGRPAWRMKSGTYDGAPEFSPDGRRALLVRHPRQVPPSWSRYDGISERAGPSNKPLVPTDFTQFVWVDLERETEEPVFDAPTGYATRVGAQSFPQALWSEDGRYVVFANAALPLPSDGNGGERVGMSYLVNYEVATGRWEILEPYRQASSGATVAGVSWTKPGKEFLVERQLNDKPATGTLYRYGKSGWTARVADASLRRLAEWNIAVKKPTLAQGLKVTLRQGANEPPTVVASLKSRELTLTAPDPALQGIWMAPTEPLQWRDAEGVTHTGGLLLPRTLPAGGEKLPLVIQAGAYQPELFRPDGPTRTAVASQALVAQNMAVLNLDIPSVILEIGGTPREMSMFIDWMESAAAEAAKKYPVDLNRVGLVGFSRAGYLVRYVITHPRSLRPAAAVIADSYTGSYALTLARHAMGDGIANEYNRIYGGAYFFESKASWLEREVSFNVDRVQTPVLFADNSENLTFVLDTIGAFKANRKPFEYLILPNGFHQLLAPRQREASLEATVDWMAFWLQGKEDAQPQKAERNERWRAQRTLHEENQRKAASATSSTAVNSTIRQ